MRIRSEEERERAEQRKKCVKRRFFFALLSLFFLSFPPRRKLRQMLASSASRSGATRRPSRPMLLAALRSSPGRRVALLCLAQQQQRQRAASTAGSSAAATTAVRNQTTLASSSSSSLVLEIAKSNTNKDRSRLTKLRVAELRSLAAQDGVELHSGLKKADLIERLLLAKEDGGKASASASTLAANSVIDDTSSPPSSSSQPPQPPKKPSPPRLPLLSPPLPPCDAQAAPTGLAVTWLGTSSGAPTKSRNVSSVAVRGRRRAVLVDAGEGSAKQLADLGGAPNNKGVPLSNVGTILITHLHGDHCFGLAATLAAVCSARAEAARALHQKAVLDAEESGTPIPPPSRQQQQKKQQTSRVLVAGPPGIASLVVAPCLLRGGRGYDAPVLVAEFTTDPAKAKPPTRVAGIDSGCEVRTATLPPDRTRAAAEALAARAARRRGGGGGGGQSRSPRFPDESDDNDSGSGDEFFGGGRSSSRASSYSYNSSTASFSSPPRRRGGQAGVHAVDVLKGLTWTLPAGTGVFSAPPTSGKQPENLNAGANAKANANAAGEGEGKGESEGSEADEGGRRRREQRELRRQQQQHDLDLFDPPITIVAAQLQHRVPCWGYALSMTEPKAREEKEGGGDEKHKEKAAEQEQAQDDDDDDSDSFGSTRKVVILGDTCDSSAMAAVARGADLLSHEATFSDRMFDKAEIAQHSTAAMAGSFAAECGARRLVLTHFSARYPDQGTERMAAGAGGRGGGGRGGRGGGGRGGRGRGRGGRGGLAAPSFSLSAGDVGDSLADDVPQDALMALVEEAKREFRARSSRGGGRGRRSSDEASAGGEGGASASSSASSAAPAPVDIEVLAATDMMTMQLPRKVPRAAGAR